MSVASSQPPDTGGQDGLTSYFNRPTGEDWDRSGFLFNTMMASNGNPRIPIAACDTTGLPGQLAKGFASFPQGWVGGALQATMMAGLLGEAQRRQAEIRNRQLAVILYAANQDLDRTYRIVRWLFVNVLPEDWAVVTGRIAGAYYTNWSLGILTLTKRLRLIGGASNFVLASYGSAILAIAKGDHQLAIILNAILTGRYEGGLCIPEAQMRNEIRKLSDKKGDDIAPALALTDQVLKLAQSLGGS